MASGGVYSSLNLGDHVGDDLGAVADNRALIERRVNARLLWLKQVHGTRVVNAADCLDADPAAIPEADASMTRQAGVACVVMTADCLPVLFCDRAGTVVAAAHAGWRGLLDGVLEATIAAMGVPAGELVAYLGPAIGPQALRSVTRFVRLSPRYRTRRSLPFIRVAAGNGWRISICWRDNGCRPKA